ncbi:GAF domain-like protein [Obelidium mucronatum]|nr:GAF domain-like protein [Obelidium mucronatum]
MLEPPDPAHADAPPPPPPPSVKFAAALVDFPKPGAKLAALAPAPGGHPSSAVLTMKAAAAMKDHDALAYMKKFTTSPYAAKSAKVQRQPIVALPTPSKSPKFPSLHVLDAAKSTKRAKSRSIDDSLPELAGRPESDIHRKKSQPDSIGAWPLHPSLIKHSTPNEEPSIPPSQSGNRSESRNRKLSRHHSDSEDDNSEVELSAEVKEKKMRDRLTLVKEEILADEHLLRLADKASQPDEILAALTALVDISAGNGKLPKRKLPFEDDLSSESLPADVPKLEQPQLPLKISRASPKAITQLNATTVFKEIIDNGLTSEAINRAIPSCVEHDALRKSCFVLQNTHHLLNMRHNHASSEDLLEQFIYKAVCDTKIMLTCEHAMLYLVDKFSGDVFACDYDPALTRLEKTLIRDKKMDPRDAGLAGMAILTRKSFNIKDDASHNTSFKNEIDSRGFTSKIYSVLCVPLATVSGEVLGVLEVLNKLDSNKEVCSFDASDEFLLKHMATQIMNALSTYSVHEQLQKLEDQRNLILKSAMNLRAPESVDDLADRVVTGAKTLLSADRCGLFLLDTKSHDLTSKILFNDHVRKIQLSSDTGIVGYTLKQGVIVNVPNAYEDSRFNPDIDKQSGYNTRSILSAPLSNPEGQSFGVLQMLNKKNGVFGPEDERLLAYFAAQATVAMDKRLLINQKGEFAQMGKDTRNYLDLVLQTVANIIITLEDSGIIREVNYPMRLEADPEFIAAMQTHTFKELFPGDENSFLVSEISSVIESKELSKSTKGYCTAMFGTKLRKINYEIKQVSELEIATGLVRKLVVVVLEDVTITERSLRTLGRYITPELANRVLAENGSELGGSRINVAVLFSNIRQYVPLSETLEPEKLVPWMNQHFEDTLNCITAGEGVVDKYVHGLTVAIFGALSQTPMDTYKACDCALKLKEGLQKLNSRLVECEKEAVPISIGINTGPIFNAYIGCPERAEIVRIGETVSIAKYMECLTQIYNTDIVVTEQSQKQVNGDFHWRELDTIRFKVKTVVCTDPIKVFALYGRKVDGRSDQILEVLELYAKGLTLYRRRQYKTASEFFESALNVIQDDGPSKAMMQRCLLYVEHPPPLQDWDGSYKITFEV